MRLPARAAGDDARLWHSSSECGKIGPSNTAAREAPMAYDLDRFITDCRDILAAEPGPSGREKVRRHLEELLAEPAFIARYCEDAKPGLTVLYEDPKLGFQILAHVNAKARVSPPHDHGKSWAIYGQATEYTDMTEWERTDNGSDPARGALKVEKKYRLTPGHAGIYQDGKIHSIDYPDKSVFIRVTGTNLDRITRQMFNLETGKITQMTPQAAS
jgi:predicted metal-dependent enzyme (double-stranded beta helix superfamily)